MPTTRNPTGEVRLSRSNGALVAVLAITAALVAVPAGAARFDRPTARPAQTCACVHEWAVRFKHSRRARNAFDRRWRATFPPVRADYPKREKQRRTIKHKIIDYADNNPIAGWCRRHKKLCKALTFCFLGAGVVYLKEGIESGVPLRRATIDAAAAYAAAAAGSLVP
jgi:hypothetical protein